jgi:ParB-like nuclease family protein
MSDPPIRSTFPKARRKKALRRVGDALTKRDTQELLPLDVVTRRLRMFEQTYVGVRPIPVSRIVGTTDRTKDFDRDFLPRRRDLGERWRRLEGLSPAAFPPITVYQVEDSYFVVDGHHRVAVAKQLGMEYIDAEVTRLKTRFRLPADADIGHIILHEQEGLFMEESGLERARPGARIRFSRPDGYLELLEHIKIHGYHLMQERGEVLSPEEIAGHWYDEVYLPGIEAIRAEGLTKVFPGSREEDLYLWVHQRRRQMLPESGLKSFQDDARCLKEAELSRRMRHRASFPSRTPEEGKAAGRRVGEGTSSPKPGH